MPKRHRHIMGTEMEWAITGRHDGSHEFNQVNGSGMIPLTSPIITDSHLPKGIVSYYSYLSNGARFYGDVGGHLEYSTPENLTLDDLVVSELAGEKLVVETLRSFLGSSSGLDEAMLLKRVIDDTNTTWGYHVNISENRADLYGPKSMRYEEQLKSRLQPLIFHYATSLVMLGAGAVQRPIGGLPHRYSLGQKVIDIEYDVSGSTTHQKPFVSSRDEPHANSSDYARLHIVGTDPHISPWATKMALGSSILMLDGIKQGRIRSLQLDGTTYSPGITIARRARLDVYGENTYNFETADGTKAYREVDIQEMYLEDLGGVTDKTPDEEWVYAEWTKALEDRKQDVMRLVNRSDAIAKLALIQRQNRNKGQPELTMDDAAMGLDKSYSYVFQATKAEASAKTVEELMGRRLAGRLRAGLFGEHMPSQDTLDNRVMHAPANTRASVRAQVIADPKYHNDPSSKLSGLDWSGYTITTGGVQQRITMDPWEGTDNE